MAQASQADSGFRRVMATGGVHNFRDYGGYAVPGSGRLRSRMIYRSGELSRATLADQALIAELDLTEIIDLRSEQERQRFPTRLGAGFAGRIIVSESYAVARPPHVRAAQEAPDAATVRARLLRAFERIPFQPVMILVFRMYFETLLDASGASLVHCHAGKDRTGIAVALLHAAMGVHPDDILEDFMLTNTAGEVAARHAAMAPGIRGEMGPAAAEDAVTATLSVEPQYLEAMFAMIEAGGGLKAYLNETLGLPGGEIEGLKQKLIV